MAIDIFKEPEGKIDLTVVAPKPVSIPHQVEAKTEKINVVLGDDSPGTDFIRKTVENGYEDRFAEMARQKKMLELENTKQDIIRDLIETNETGTVTEQDVEFIRGMSQVDLEETANAPDILQTEYAKKFALKTLEADERKIVIDAMNEDPEQASQIIDMLEKDAKNTELVHSLIDDLERRKANTSWLGATVDFAESMIPIWSNLRTMSVVEGAPTASNLMGSNLKEQFDYLHSLPTHEQFKEEATKAYLTLAEANPALAEQFLQGLISWSTNEENEANAWTVLDVADVATVVGGVGMAGAKAVGRVGKVGKANKALRNAAKTVLEAQRGRVPDITNIARTTGNVRTAAVSRVVKRVLSQISGKDATKGIDNLENNIQSIINPRSWSVGTPNLARNVEEELIDAAERRGNIAQEILTGIDKVERTVVDRLYKIADDVFEANIASKWRGLQATVMDIAVNNGRKYRLEADPLANTNNIIVTMGSKKGMPFKNELAAQKAIADRQLSDANVVPYGSGYVIEHRVDLPETFDYFKDSPMPNGSKAKTGFLNSIFGMARSPRHVLGESQAEARNIVTHGTQRMFQLYSEMAEPIGKLKGDLETELKTALAYNRDNPHPITGGDRGHWFENAAEMDEYWQKKFGHTPTAEQFDAYQAYRQLNDLDYAIRAIGQYRDKLRQGIEKFSIKLVHPTVKEIKHPDGTVVRVSDPKGVDDLVFEGKLVDSINEAAFRERPPRVAFYDGSNVKVMSAKHNPADVLEMINKLKADGHSIIQAADGNLRVPRSQDEMGVAYIVTKNFNKERLSIDFSYRGGPHVINRHPFYAKQAGLYVGKNGERYLGEDIAIFSAPTEKVLRARVDAFNKAVQMMKASDAGLEDFVAKELAMDLDDFLRLFKPRKNAKGETVPGLNADMPVVAVRSGQRSTDVAKIPEDVYDLTNNPHNLYAEMDRKFTGERDASNLMVYETEGDVIQRLDDGDLFDPFETLNRAAYNIVDLHLKRDYALKSANDWVEQFRDLLDVPYSELARNPSRYLYNPTYLSGADSVAKRNAEIARKQILGFLSATNKEESAFESIQNKILNYAYETGGSKRLDTAKNYLIPVIKDPLTFGRTVASHLKLGLFNPQQLLVQTQTAAVAIAVSPRAGWKGFTAAYAARMATLNPHMLEHSTNAAVKLGWKAEEFKEMVELFQKSGYYLIRGSHGTIDDIANPRIFPTSGGKFLDAGMFFFREAETFVRATGFATAYLERKAQLGGKAISKADRAWILKRADDLGLNMSASNNAIWQRGLLGVPLQFASYQARMVEAYFGKTFTPAEKARMFAMQSALYGLPTAAGGALGVWPMYETVKYHLENNGVSYNDNVLLEGVVQGLPALGLKAMGIEADFASRFGAGGVTFTRDLVTGQKSLLETLGGASGSIWGDALGVFQPAVATLGSIVTGNPNVYDFGVDDLTNVLKNVSTVNNGLKLWYALNYGKWLSKSGSVVDDVTTGEAFMMAITGMSPDRIDQGFTKLEVLNDRKEYIKAVTKEVRDAFMQGGLEDDPKIRAEYFRKAWAIAQLGGLTHSEFGGILGQSILGEDTTMQESIARRLEEDWQKRQGKGYAQ